MDFFFSKMLYCLPLFSNCWGVETMQEGVIRRNSFTQANLRALQILQNKVLRLLTGHSYDTHIKTLLKDSEMMSVNQMIAFSTINTTFKIKKSGKPVYLVKRLGFDRNAPIHRPFRNPQQINIDYTLNTSREGFVYSAAKLWSSLPISLKSELIDKSFKKDLKVWIHDNIPSLPL